MTHNHPLLQLKNLAPRSVQMLQNIGISTRQELEQVGVVSAWLIIKKSGASLNLLWAMVGALSDQHGCKIACHERSRLLIELDAMQQSKS